MSIDRRRTAGGFVPLRDAIDQLFEGSFIAPNEMGNGFPHSDMHVTENDVIVHMAIPGASPDDIAISVTGDILTVSGEVRRKQETERRHAYMEEIWRGRFQRSFGLPMQVDPNRADATFENGILTLTLPRAEATKPRRIQVRGAGSTIDGTSSQGSSSEQGKTEHIEVETPKESGRRKKSTS